jgi:hypothetical protein
MREGVGQRLSYRKSTESLGKLNDVDGLDKLNEKANSIARPGPESG